MRAIILFFTIVLTWILLSVFGAVAGGRRALIQPVPWTNQGQTVTQLEVDTANNTDVSVDVLWYLYDGSNGLVDEGRVQIGDSLFAVYNGDKVNFPGVLVAAKLGLTFKEN